MAVALCVMHILTGLLSFLQGKCISGKVISNKQLVRPISHVFNQPFATCGRCQIELELAI